MKARNGQELAVALPDGAPITTLTKRTLGEIGPGEFVGSAAVAGKDGMLHAQEVHIFPESMPAPERVTARWQASGRGSRARRTAGC